MFKNSIDHDDRTGGSNFQDRSGKILLYLSIILSISVFLTIVMGGIVSSMETNSGCLDWPTCLGQWTLPTGSFTNLIVFDYLHRFLTFVSGILIVVGLMFTLKFYKNTSWIKRAYIRIFSLTFLQILIGGMISQRWLALPQSWMSTFHMLLSLFVLGLSIYLTTTLFITKAQGIVKPVLRFRSFYALSYLILILFFILLTLSGLMVSNNQVISGCENELGSFAFTTCLRSGQNGWIFGGHQLIVALTGVALTFLFLYSWRTQRSQIPVLVSTTIAFVLFFAQAFLGIKMALQQPAYLIALHHITAVGLWAALSVGLITTGYAARDNASEIQEGAGFRLTKAMMKDLLMLTKPIVVVLLLVTTYAGMVIAGGSWPSLKLTFWTMLAGFMAAGGSGAVNQFIDRSDDGRMQRTQKRPIPSGRLTPAEGLAFGVGMLLVSFYLLVAFVNLLAAILSLAGMIYYVLIYSILLKKTTVQNIVIGGGAGAIPPLVGWAAVTGSLNVPSLLLFVIVFMWTPPHFWALALVRKNDYARAGVPMLPVVRGEKETRKQILVYTIGLVLLTLILPMFGLGGNIYLMGAVVLGVWLLLAAWKVWRNGGNKLAWKMYRYSSMYLAFLFAVLMMDALL